MERFRTNCNTSQVNGFLKTWRNLQRLYEKKNEKKSTTLDLCIAYFPLVQSTLVIADTLGTSFCARNSESP